MNIFILPFQERNEFSNAQTNPLSTNNFKHLFLTIKDMEKGGAKAERK